MTELYPKIDPTAYQDESDKTNQPKCLGHVVKSPLDPRKYKAIELPNGLKVVLISTLGFAKAAGSYRTCHLKRIMDFNQVTCGLDSSMYNIRCECMPNPNPPTLDKTTWTNDDNMSFGGEDYVETEGEADGAKDDQEESDIGDAVKAIKNLIYGAGSTTTMGSTYTETTTTDETIYDDDDDPEGCSVFLSVGAGWFNDPEDMPGMAHFVEHCFFLGSEKYPHPNQLFRLIFPHDGFANAYTASNQTVYTISTSIEIFALALDILSDGIGFPLLPRELVSKEMDALDAEFSLRQDDLPKYNQLLASLALDGHPLRNMDTGNIETLRVPGFYKKIVDWRKEHYSANYMTLCIEAPLEIVEMEELAMTYFSRIPSSDLPSPSTRISMGGKPFLPKTFHRIYHVPSVYHSEFMAIHWALDPSVWKNLSVKVFDYLGALIGGKGEGGLFQFLYYFGLVTDITAGNWDSDVFTNQYTSIFTIYLDLTEEGFEQQDNIIEAVFAYLEMLNQSKPSKCFFEELQKEHVDHFHQKAIRESTSYCEDVAWWLHNVPASQVLVAPHLLTKFDEDFISNCTEQLRLETCNIMVFSKKYLETEKQTSIESFYQTPYSSRDFTRALYAKVENMKPVLSKAFHLPRPNPYINNLTCCGTQQSNLVRNGSLMVVQGKCSIFFKDEKFQTLKGQLPQAKYVFWFHSPVMNNGDKSETSMDLFCHFLNDMIVSKFSSALAAHFHIHSKITPGKLELSLTGPSDQLPKVAKDVFRILTFFERLLDKRTFRTGKQIFIENLDNIALDNRVHAWEVMNYLWTNHYQLSTENIRQTEKIEYDNFIQFVKDFKRKVYIACHLHGFITIDQAFHVVRTVAHFMRTYPETITPKEITSLRCPILPIGESIVKIRSRNERIHTSVVINGYQFGPLEHQDNRIVDFLAKCMGEAAYHKLRTLEQIGYIVSVAHDEAFGVTSLFFEVVTQPKNFTTDYCNKRVDEFIQEFYDTYIADHNKFKAFLKDKPKKNFDFIRVRDIYRTHLLPTSPVYRKLSVQIVGTLVDGLVLLQKTHIVQIPTIYFTDPNDPPPRSMLKPEWAYIGLSASMSSTLDKKSTKTSRTKRGKKGKDVKKGNGKSKGIINYSDDHLLQNVACGDLETSFCPRLITRVVDDIHKFKAGLDCYPNPEPEQLFDDAVSSCSTVPL